MQGATPVSIEKCTFFFFLFPSSGLYLRTEKVLLFVEPCSKLVLLFLERSLEGVRLGLFLLTEQQLLLHSVRGSVEESEKRAWLKGVKRKGWGWGWGLWGSRELLSATRANKQRVLISFSHQRWRRILTKPWSALNEPDNSTAVGDGRPIYCHINHLTSRCIIHLFVVMHY